MLQKVVVQNQEFAEMKQREADKEKIDWQSNQNRMLIEKEKKKGKPKKEKKKKAEEKREEAEILDASEWKIVGRYMDRAGPMFEVDMTGIPKDPGDDGQYATRKDLFKDKAVGIVDEYIRNNCNYTPWKELLSETYEEEKEGGQGPKKKIKRMRKAEVAETANDGKQLITNESKEAKCNHDIYELSVTYVPEENAAYCKQGCYLFGTRCASCTKEFVADKKGEREKEKGCSFRASGDTPIYCCINIRGKGGTGWGRRLESVIMLCVLTAGE
jgi:hypothetical protein